MPPTPDTSPAQETSLPSAELLLSAIVDSSDDAIVSKNMDGIVTSWNRAAERIFGYTRDEMIGRPIIKLLPPNRQAEEQAILERLRRGEVIDHFETFRRRKDGQMIEVAVTISPIMSPDGSIVGASKIARDITEQKRSGQASALLAAIVSSSDDAIVSKNLDGIITSWNNGAQRIFGYTAEEAVGQAVLMLIPEDRKEEEKEILVRLRRGERVDHFETIRVRKNGSLFPVSLTISPVKDHNGTIVGASKIARDITEVKRITRELEQLLESERVARSRAETANRLKDEFLATVSHELRTPLNAIVGWTQVLKDTLRQNRDAMEGVEVIERNAHVQAQLIDDLLDLGRITTGKMTLATEWLEVGKVINDAIASVRPAAETKQISVHTLFNEAGASLMGDRKRLQQVMWNLVSNAIKFTPKKGRVTVGITRVNSHVEITVSDNGRGIAPEFIPHVFEQFRQADASTTRHYGGLGIGLSLVKQLVELHGGEVRAESPGLDLGATFTISLPVAVTRPEARRLPASTPPLLQSGDDLAGIRVLAVDDDRDSLEVVKRVLLARGALVRGASSVEEALETFSSFHPEVVVSDIGMPGHDGYEFIRRLRQLPGGAGIPAAALTALARAEDRMRALQAGFQTHVVKPVVPAELIAVVQSLTALTSQRRT